MGDIVLVGQLASYLQHQVRADSELTAIRVAEGLVRGKATALGWPPAHPVPEDLWAWTLELVGLTYNNPTNLASRTTDEETRTWAVQRRREILDAIEECYGTVTGDGGPQGSFPIVLDWPDGAHISSSLTKE